MILGKLTPNHPDIPALKKLIEEAFEKFMSGMAAGIPGATLPKLYRRD